MMRKVAVAAAPKRGSKAMSTVTAKDGVEIFYQDWGKGQSIVFK